MSNVRLVVWCSIFVLSSACGSPTSTDAGSPRDAGSDARNRDAAPDDASSCDRDGDGVDSVECGGVDCDDADPTTFGGNTEICDSAHDEDCNPLTVGPTDADEDGFISSACCNADGAGERCGDDCDDARMDVRPTAGEICNGVDDDCDGRIDEGVLVTFYRDVDGDDFGLDGMTTQACSAPVGYATRGGDCDDMVRGINPGVSEVCDAMDNDCDGTTDIRADGTPCPCVSGQTQSCGHPDGAGGFVDVGECAIGTQRCVEGEWAECVGDVRPRAELCNTLDDDCDGVADDGVTTTYHRDADGDGYGVGTDTIEACSPSGAYILHPPGATYDCDDSRGSVHPDAAELCNAIDDDCDGLLDAPNEDDDGDGHADPTCGGDDCDETQATVNPSAPELCDGRDNTCDGIWEDRDGDRHGRTGFSCVVPTSGAIPMDDCQDGVATVYPGATYMDAPWCPPGYSLLTFATGPACFRMSPPDTRAPSWDYDCDGAVTKQPAFSGSCSNTCSGSGCPCRTCPCPAELATCGTGTVRSGPVYSASDACGTSVPYHVCQGCTNSCSLVMLAGRVLRCR